MASGYSTGGDAGIPMLAREQELAMLMRAIHSPPALVVVQGEAGVGKTRLITAACEAATREGRTVLVGNCHPQRGSLPLQPVMDALQQVVLRRGLNLTPVVGALRPLLPSLADKLPPAAEPMGDRRSDMHLLFRGIRELLTALRRTVLVLEDIHWGDETAGELLQFLVNSLPPELTLILTFRDESLSEASWVRGLGRRLAPEITHLTIDVTALDADGVAEMIRAVLREDVLSTEFLTLVHQRTAGLPLAVEQVLQLLKDRGEIARLEGRWALQGLDGLELPQAIREAIMERLAALPEPAQRIINVASILQIPAADELLLAVSGLSEGEGLAALDQAIASGLLQVDTEGRSLPCHDLARQAIHDGMTEAARHQLHLVAAEVLRRDPDCPAIRLAEHYRYAGREADWVAYAARAADMATQRFDEAAAQAILEEVLASAMPSAATRARLAEKLGDAALESRSPGSAIDLMRSVIDDQRLETADRGALRLMLGAVLTRAGRMAEAHTEYARSVPDLGDRPEALAVALTALAFPAAPEGHVRDHQASLDRAETLAEASGDRQAQLAVQVARVVLPMWFGDPRAMEGVQWLRDRGRALSQRRACARFTCLIAEHAAYLGHMVEAGELCAEARVMAEEIDYSPNLPKLVATELLLDMWMGRWEGLPQRAQAIAEDVDANPYSRVPALYVSSMLEMVFDGGRPELEDRVRVCIAEAGRAGNLPIHNFASGLLGRLRLRGRDPGGALKATQPALDMARTKGIWLWATDAAPVAVEALILTGHKDDAAALTGEYTDGLSGRSAPAALASLATCRALMGETPHLDAARAWADVPRPYDAVLTRQRAIPRVLATDSTEGQALITEVLKALEELGAVRDAARLRRRLRSQGVVVAYPGRRGRRPYGDTLSPQERAIVNLAVKQLADRDIAESLSLSPRTVEHHMERAMRKLGITSRAQLSGALDPERPD